MTDRVEPIFRRNLIEALQDMENAHTQKDKQFHMGKAFAYVDALRKLSQLDGYTPTAGIAPPTVGIDSGADTTHVEKFVGPATSRDILGLDVTVEVSA